MQLALAGMLHYKARETWVITINGFTKSAKELATSTRIRFIDRKITKTRVLIAFEDEYRTYREFMASAVQTHRPQIEVVSADLGGIEEVAPFDPQLVICSQPNTVDSGDRPAWVEPPGPRAAG